MKNRPKKEAKLLYVIVLKHENVYVRYEVSVKSGYNNLDSGFRRGDGFFKVQILNLSGFKPLPQAARSRRRFWEST
jgi:hypothetical protein